MISDFTFHAPSFVSFGMNSSTQTGSLLKKWGANGKVMMVHGQNIKKKGLAEAAVRSILDAGLEVCAFEGVLPDSPVESVRDGIAFAKRNKVGAIVAVGGGSAMDTAKAIALMVDREGDILDYCRGKLAPARRGVLLFAIPTTCGTGSEATDIGVILDRENEYKFIFADPSAGPDVAILDPALLMELPPRMIAATAMDAFSHSAEAYTCRAANIMMEPLALSSMRMIVDNLKRAVQSPPDPEALATVLIASAMAGQAFTQVGLHVGHAIAHGIGVHGKVHHGVACALALPYALRCVSGEIPERVAKIGEILGLVVPEGASPEKIGELVADALLAFNREVGIGTLGDYGVTGDKIDAMAEYGVNEKGTQGNSHRASPKNEVVEYLRMIL